MSINAMKKNSKNKEKAHLTVALNVPFLIREL